jgi:LacI family transcriptional regulator
LETGLPVTLKDIARECGLAVSTVSNILNNHHSSFASEAVRDRVRSTALRLGYKKNYLSSSLRTRKTRSVGLILDEIAQVTRQEFLVSVVEPLSRRGYEVSIAEHRHDPDRAVAALEGFAERYKEGVILFTDLLGRTEAEQERVRAAVLPLNVVGIGSKLRGTVPSLDVDRGYAADATMRHFFTRGHQRILMVFEYEWDLRPSFSYWDHPQITFWRGIHTAGDFLSRADQTDWTTFDAVFFRTDRIAIAALGFFRSRGILIPDDLEVIGFDNYPFTEHTLPSLSTWDIGFGRLGTTAHGLLSAWLEGNVPASDWYQSFRPEFISRGSHSGDPVSRSTT